MLQYTCDSHKSFSYWIKKIMNIVVWSHENIRAQILRYAFINFTTCLIKLHRIHWSFPSWWNTIFWEKTHITQIILLPCKRKLLTYINSSHNFRLHFAYISNLRYIDVDLFESKHWLEQSKPENGSRNTMCVSGDRSFPVLERTVQN